MFEDFILNLIGLLTYQVIGVALFLPFELAFPKQRIGLKARADGFIFLMATALVTALVFAIVNLLKAVLHLPTLIVFHHSLWSPVLAAIVGALWIDLQFYTVHRLEHRFFWRFHAVHHSVRNLSAANSYHHWTESLMGLPLAIPLLFIDVQIGPTLAVLAFLFRYQQFYIHSASRPHFGPLRWMLVDNRYHRIHHSMEQRHYDKNFGAMSPLWDWLFGTLHMPKSNEWPDVGLAEVDEPTSLREWSNLPWRYRRAISQGPSSKSDPERATPGYAGDK